MVRVDFTTTDKYLINLDSNNDLAFSIEDVPGILRSNNKEQRLRILAEFLMDRKYFTSAKAKQFLALLKKKYPQAFSALSPFCEGWLCSQFFDYNRINQILTPYMYRFHQLGYNSKEYLMTLIKNSGISVDQIVNILQKSSQPIERLILICLFMKIKKNQLMSSRYNDYLTVVLNLLRNNKLQIVFQLPAFATGSKYLSRGSILIIALKKGMFVSEAGKRIFEEMVVHELYHAYQDYQRIPKWKTGKEAEAYLASSDYMQRVYPMDVAKGWFGVQIYEAEGTLFVYFNVPRAIVNELRNKKVEDSEYLNRLLLIRKKFAYYKVFTGLVSRNSPISEMAKNSFLHIMMNDRHMNFWQKMKDIINRSIQGYSNGNVTYYKANNRIFMNFSHNISNLFVYLHMMFYYAWFSASAVEKKEMAAAFAVAFRRFIKYTRFVNIGIGPQSLNDRFVLPIDNR